MAMAERREMMGDLVDDGGGEEGKGVTGAMNARQGNTPVYTGGVAGAVKGQARGHPPFYT